MMSRTHVDALYSAFCGTLPRHLSSSENKLREILELASAADAKWGNVYLREVTLAAPSFFAEVMPSITDGDVRDAVMCHLLSVLGARVEREIARQQERSADVNELLARLRDARDRAGANLWSSAPLWCGDADRQTASAVTDEQVLLQGAEPVSLGQYQALILRLHRPALSGSIALAHKARWEPRRLEAVKRTLQDVWLARELESQVNGWKDDWVRRGACVVCLARGLRAGRRSEERPTEPSFVRRMVVESGVLTRLLGRSRAKFRSASRRARALGAHHLAEWAKQAEERAAFLERLERKATDQPSRAVLACSEGRRNMSVTTLGPRRRLR
ncbi:MAG TPA: hypothetical protein VGJ84_02905 [Polyangiaceae bacterium]